MSEQHCDAACPLRNVHRRMDDAHRLWHQALSSYFAPDEFRVAVHSCIQTLRSVTFLLQKNQHVIPDFDAWYDGWRERMKADGLMTWAKEARNHIEKKGDLESHSSVRAQVIASYLNEFPVVEVEACLFESLKALCSRIPCEVLERQIMEHGVIKVERRWVANGLPDYELLDALAAVYGFLAALVDDAHHHFGLPVPPTMIVPGNEIQAAAAGASAEGRLQCMVATDNERSIYISLKTGQLVRYDQDSRLTTDEELEEAAKRYDLSNEIQLIGHAESLSALAHAYFQVARRLFLNDGYHSTIAFLVCDHRCIKHVEVICADRSQKYVSMRLVADEVRRCKADALMLIGEYWSADSGSEQPFIYPCEMLDHTEDLSLHVCAKNGEEFSLTAEIIRHGDTTKLAHTIESDQEVAIMFQPIREIWKY